MTRDRARRALLLPLALVFLLVSGASRPAVAEISFGLNSTLSADCDALTSGFAGEICTEPAGAMYVCQPTAGACDTAGEWISVSGGGGGSSPWTDLGAVLTPTGGESVIFGGDGDVFCETSETCITGGTVIADALSLRDQTTTPGNYIETQDNDSAFVSDCSVANPNTISIRDSDGLTSAITPSLCVGTTEVADLSRPLQTVRWTFNDASGIANGDCLVVNTANINFTAIANCNLQNHGHAFHTSGPAQLVRLDCALDETAWFGAADESLDFEVNVLENATGTVGVATGFAVTVVRSVASDAFAHFAQTTPVTTAYTDGAFVLRVANVVGASGITGTVKGACVLTYR